MADTDKVIEAAVKAGRLKVIHIPADMPCDIDEVNLRLEEVTGLLDMLSDQPDHSAVQSVALTALRLVKEAREALVGPRRARP